MYFTFSLVVLQVLAIISATAFCPKNKLFQLWDSPASDFNFAIFFFLNELPSLMASKYCSKNIQITIC